MVGTRFLRGYVHSVRDGICTIVGLPRTKAGEVLYIAKTTDFLFSERFAGNNSPEKKLLCKRKQVERAAKFNERFLKALVLNLNRGFIGAMVLGNDRLVEQGSIVFRTGRLLKIKTSLAFFGHVLNSLGELIDDEDKGVFALRRAKQGGRKIVKIVFIRDRNNIRNSKFEGSDFVEKKATGIIDRTPVRVPLLTGLTSVDSLVPIGRGQRELIIGDKQTGKTSVAVDAILNHVALNSHYLGLDDLDKPVKSSIVELGLRQLRNIVWFIYCGIGQKQSTISGIRSKLKNNNAFWYTAIVSATSSESAPLQFLAPYSACTLGEFVRDRVGGHSVVIFDDLSKHAVAYRQMSLLLRRPPGREAFPGDVFYVHSRLLERAGALVSKIFKRGEKKSRLVRGTLTAFPVIETQAGDVSAYIPTNVISITDGQIFLETELFYRGVRPAINVGLSVSRVGSAAQPQLMKTVSGSLKMELAQFREIEGFAKLGANLDEHTKRLLTRGENLIEVLKQDVHSPLSTFVQALMLFAGMGYTGKMLAKINRLCGYILSTNESKGIGRVPSSLLINTRIISSSWLELLRLKSTEFQIDDVRVFLSGVISFLGKVGILELFNWTSAYQISNRIISKAPHFFMNDLFMLYLVEFGAIKFQVSSNSRVLSLWGSSVNLPFSISSISLDEFLIPQKRIVGEKNIGVKQGILYRMVNTKRILFEGAPVLQFMGTTSSRRTKSLKFSKVLSDSKDTIVLSQEDRSVEDGSNGFKDAFNLLTKNSLKEGLFASVLEGVISSLDDTAYTDELNSTVDIKGLYEVLSSILVTVGDKATEIEESVENWLRSWTARRYEKIAIRTLTSKYKSHLYNKGDKSFENVRNNIGLVCGRLVGSMLSSVFPKFYVSKCAKFWCISDRWSDHTIITSKSPKVKKGGNFLFRYPLVSFSSSSRRSSSEVWNKFAAPIEEIVYLNESLRVIGKIRTRVKLFYRVLSVVPGRE